MVAGDPSSGTWTRRYDTAGRLNEEFAPNGRRMARAWDAASNRTLLCVQDDPNAAPATFTYCRYDTWDARNRHASPNGLLLPSTDIVLLFTNAYDQLGRLASRAYPNATSTAYAYAGQSGDVSSIAHNLAGGVQDLYGTTYNRVHQAAQQTTSGPAAHPRSAGIRSYGPGPLSVVVSVDHFPCKASHREHSRIRRG